MSELICVCMATCEPPADLFRAQVESLRAQADAEWTCVVCDDASGPAALAMMREAIGGDERFALHEHPERLGTYRNFERALALAPPAAELLAFADQDDRWYPEKLAVLREALTGGALLAYSDMRVVAEDGRVLSETYWSARRNNHTDISQLLVANTVTGAASLFRRSLLDRALPFPEAGELAHHDHWVALVALALGEIAYVDRPLYDYVQHGDAALGHEVANRPNPEPGAAAKARRLAAEAARLRRGEERAAARRARLERRRLDVPFLEGTLANARALLERCGAEMAPAKRRRIRRFLTLDSPRRGFAWLGWRTLRARTDGPTLGHERRLLRGKMGLAARR